MSIRSLGILANPMKPDRLALVARARRAAAQLGVRILAGPGSLVSEADTLPMEALVRQADALLVIGGDGTILHALGCMGESLLPILGVNLGTLGFLAECAPDEIESAIRRLIGGAYTLEERMLLTAETDDQLCYTALNDIVVSRGHFSRMLRVEVGVNGSVASIYTGDGCIIASPTGSTAYSLSSGGPIVSPALPCFIITPICPHTLSSRTMIVPADALLSVKLSPRDGEDGGMVLTVDGGKRGVFFKAATLTVKRSDQKLSFIRFGEEKFFRLLQKKLAQWGEIEFS